MNLPDYEDFVEGLTWVKEENRFEYFMQGLLIESGEALSPYQKALRGDWPRESIDKADTAKELGDVAFMLVGACHAAGYSLAEVLSMNYDKLQGRAARGTLPGNGDHR